MNRKHAKSGFDAIYLSDVDASASAKWLEDRAEGTNMWMSLGHDYVRMSGYWMNVVPTRPSCLYGFLYSLFGAFLLPMKFFHRLTIRSFRTESLSRLRIRFKETVEVEFIRNSSYPCTPQVKLQMSIVLADLWELPLQSRVANTDVARRVDSVLEGWILTGRKCIRRAKILQLSRQSTRLIQRELA